jgi:NADH-quinone oxidoreductase subunit G
MARKLIIDGKEIEADDNLTLLQACEQAGAEIPRFCYHERLSVAGNCRMCLVEWVGAPKPQASCALQVKDIFPNKDGTPAKINTNSAYVKKAREGVMEFLLINHPLDCPICDQGGECDLQDQAMGYGRAAFHRFNENKRAVEDKYMGPLIKTIMTRCIQCTRCVRFATEVAGVPDLGATGRGEDMEITTYLEKAFSSELSGNAVDLCPVGALTHKPWAFIYRPWELSKTESIDVMDAQGCNVRVDARGREVLRVLPRVNDDINEEWLSDKSRYACDGLKRQRLDQPFIRKNGKLVPVSWGEAFAAISARMKATKPEAMAAIVGDLAAAEEIKALKDLMASLGVTNLECRQDGSKVGGTRPTYLFNSTIAGVDAADALLLIGANPRWEAPVLNARIRKGWLNGLKIANIGEAVDLTYPVTQLGETVSALQDIANGKGDFATVLKDAKRPMIVVGPGALARADGAAILNLAAKLAGDIGAIGPAGTAAEGGWNGFNVLHTAASRVAALDLGLQPATWPPFSMAHRKARSVLSICLAPMSLTHPNSAALLWSIRARMAMRARIARTSFSRVRLTRKRKVFTRTSRAGCSAENARSFLPERPRKIGPFCVRFPKCWAGSCLTTISKPCVPPSSPTRRISLSRCTTRRPFTKAPIPRSGTVSASPAS